MERRIGQLLLAGVVIAAGCLLCGLGAFMIGAAPTAAALMNAGLVLLMATPVMRVVLSVAEYARVRDWPFVLTACAVLAILAVSVFYAARA